MMTNSTLEKYDVTQFEGKDYDYWKISMEVIFDHQDVKSISKKRLNILIVCFVPKTKNVKTL